MKPDTQDRLMTRRLLAAAVLAAGMSLSTAQAAMAPAAENAENLFVGEVSLVLGKAWLLGDDESRTEIASGTRIRATDRILTAANGHVHIRFIDQALVSVRPDSRLEIVRYDYNPDQPQQSSIKLNLEEGVTRAISGKGASSARDRFRLNTPIAAIGVRGTDFVVSATDRSVRALVNEGAIIMAPYSAECLMDAFGPCASNAVELTGNSLQIIEMDGDTASPRLLPAPHEREPGLMREEVQLAVQGAEDEAEDKTAGTGVYLENVTSRKVRNEVASVTPPVTPKPPAITDFTPEQPVASDVLSQNQLVWGRYGIAGQEKITLPYLAAGQGREWAVGSMNVGYSLFRVENGSQRVQAGLGPVSFALDSAQAFYHSDSGVVAMAVNGGSLDINFDDSTFATELNLSHAATGKVDFNAAGKINKDNGYFGNFYKDQISGAVSIDGSEAGYFFEKQLENGGIQGLTLWGKQ